MLIINCNRSTTHHGHTHHDKQTLRKSLKFHLSWSKVAAKKKHIKIKTYKSNSLMLHTRRFHGGGALLDGIERRSGRVLRF